MGFVLSPKRLVTVRFASLRLVESAAAEMACIQSPSSVGVFTVLLEAMVDRAADLLEAAGAELDGLSRQTFPQLRRRQPVGGPGQPVLAPHPQPDGPPGRPAEQDPIEPAGGGAAGPLRHRGVQGLIAPEFMSRLGAVRDDLLSLADYET